MFGLAFQSRDFAALLQFLETQGNVQVLSSPRIATINNQKAVLKVGTDEFFVTSVSTSTTSSANNNVTSPTINVQPFFSGIALDVTPQIGEGDAIILHLHPSVSVVAEKQKNVNLGALGNFQLPLAASTVNESDSVVRVQDGHIVAIGGLMKQRESGDASGLPGTTGSSVLGTLFGQRARSSTKSELVMLLKPTIIRGESDWQRDVADVQQRLRSLEPVAAATSARRRSDALSVRREQRSRMYLAHFGLRRDAVRADPGHRLRVLDARPPGSAEHAPRRRRRRRGLHQDHRRSRHRQDAALPALPRRARTGDCSSPATCRTRT